MKRLNCDPATADRIRANLDGFQGAVRVRAGERRAAVALTVVEEGFGPDVYGLEKHPDWRSDAALVLTRRAAGLRNHSGQWAIPGGRLEPGESPESAALRELHEEVGLYLPPERVLGRLDDFETRSGFVITPVVVWGGCGVVLTANPREVAAIHRIPVAEFLREDAPILHPQAQSEHPVLLMPVGESFIAAPTAAMLYQFREVAIFGRQTRVAHYEQPFFAWK